MTSALVSVAQLTAATVQRIGAEALSSAAHVALMQHARRDPPFCDTVSVQQTFNSIETFIHLIILVHHLNMCLYVL